MLEKFLNYPNKAVLDYDLTFLYGLRERIPLEGNGPCNMILNGDKLIIPTYFCRYPEHNGYQYERSDVGRAESRT